ncbi:cytochrome P450 monooxygenase [Biscogniauxia sp. FL1348]|nr:cytochrome P450 monooxygenase [Biscogniauxia sp. FL1348]
MAPRLDALPWFDAQYISLRPYHWAIVGLLLVFFYGASTAIYNLYFHPLSHIPGPKLWAMSPIPYALAECSGRGHWKLLELHEKYGPLIRIDPRTVSITDSAVWKEVFGHRKPGKLENSKEPKFFSDMPHSVIGSVSSEDHGRQRRILSRGFSSQSMVSQEPLIRRHIDLLFRRMHDFADRDEPVNVVAWYNYTTFDILGDLAFGSSFGCLETGTYHKWVSMIFEGVRQKHYLRQIRRVFPWVYTVLDPIIQRIVAPIVREGRELTENKVHQRLALGTERPDFMQSMIATTENGERKMSMAEIYDNADILILAGSETTATALSGITSLLCTHPEVLAKLQNEVDTSFKSEEEITLLSVQKLRYMMHVINEGLRVYPSAAGSVPRMINPAGETVLGKYLPPNTVVDAYHWVIYHNSSNFSSPMAFIPERWDESVPGFANDAKDAFEPFSYGGRNCLGKNLGYAEMRLILARLIWNFNIELADPKDKDWIYGQPMYSLWEKPSLNIRLTHRTH